MKKSPKNIILIFPFPNELSPGARLKSILTVAFDNLFFFSSITHSELHFYFSDSVQRRTLVHLWKTLKLYQIRYAAGWRANYYNHYLQFVAEWMNCGHTLRKRWFFTLALRYQQKTRRRSAAWVYKHMKCQNHWIFPMNNHSSIKKLSKHVLLPTISDYEK